MITTKREHKKGLRPKINLTVVRVEPKVWKDLGFYKHHYMSEDLNPSCKCFLFLWDNVPVGFVGLINQPMKGYKWGFRISRIVILPDFQGLGLSSDMLKFIGQIVKNYHPTAQLYIKTVHDKMGKHFEKSALWSATSYNGKYRNDPNDEGGKYRNRLKRVSYCYKFEGDKIEGYEDLMENIKTLRDKKKKTLDGPTLFDENYL